MIQVMDKDGKYSIHKVEDLLQLITDLHAAGPTEQLKRKYKNADRLWAAMDGQARDG